LLAVPAHKGDCRPEANAYTVAIVHKSTLGGNASDNIFGGQARPSDRNGVSSVMAKFCHWPGALSKQRIMPILENLRVTYHLPAPGGDYQLSNRID